LSQEYFQQEVNFNIHVSLDDELHELNGFESIEYINNSPDTLNFLYFHLWPNAYSSNTTPLAKQLFRLNGKAKLFDDPELRGYIDSLDFKANGKQLEWKLLPGQPDVCRIDLNRSLLAGDTIIITTPFRVKIPMGVTSRLGHIGQSYQISQWYPKPAVYDPEGWHHMSYLDQGEFFSEFGKFDVKIMLPKNYIVGATGTLQNPSEVEMLEGLAADTAWVQSLILEGNDFPPSSEEKKTLRFTAEQVHDFAWFADKRFHVLKGKVKLPNSGREVETMVLFTNEQAGLWKDALGYVNDAVLYFSEKIGDYPYPAFTAVQSALTAGYGMEYPGITVVGQAEDAYSLDEVIAHEIAHNWFYGALASNERQYPFMDEGMASAYTTRYMAKKYPEKNFGDVYVKNKKLAKFLDVTHLPVARMQELEWLVQARNNLEQPINLPATAYNDLNYGLIIYNKAATVFNYLRAYLGDSLFDATIQVYYHQWMFKHPRPEDLRNVFKTQTGQDLSWFFEDLIGTRKRLDYKIVGLKGQQLFLKNKGELVSPLIIAGKTGDSIFFEKWVDGFEGKQWIEISPGNYKKIKIDPQHVMPELFRLNNDISKSGIFRKSSPLSPKFIYTVESPEERQLMYFPVVNLTEENGFMLGMAVHNGFMVPKPLEYFMLPFVAFGNSDLAGFGRIAYNMIPYGKFVRKATISLEGTQFGAPGDQNYKKVKTGLDLYFRNSNRKSPFAQKAFVNYIAASSISQIKQGEKAKMNSYLQFGYQWEKHGFINPFSVAAFLEAGKSYQKTSVDLNYRVSYYGRNKGLDIRLFTGTMLKNTPTVPFYAFSASGRGGSEQYLFPGAYPGRFSDFPSSFWSRQMAFPEGGLVSPVNESLGYSQWLVSLSFTSNLPGKAGLLPLKPFANFLLNDHGLPTGPGSPFFFEAGIKAGIWDLFEIYVPLLVSDNIQSATGPFKDRIRFVFSLASLSKMKLTGR
jgi:hypothetical protein